MPNISDINGVAVASLGDFNGVAKASITDINGVTIVVSGTNLLLDTYTGAAAAYSVRKLDKDYSGSCMRIRRDSDDSETDIGFDSSGDLDTSAIATHCGSANGYLVTWYDQANVGGTAANATQSLGSRQPQIYNGSGVITENGKPAVKSGANMGLEAQVAGELKGFSVSFLSTAKSVLFHRSQVVRTGNGWFLAAEQTSSTALIDTAEYSNVAIRKNGSAYSLTSKTRQDLYNDFSSQHLLHFNADMSTGSITQYFIGYNWAGTNWTYSMFSTQELILYPSTSSHSISAIEGNVNAYYQIGNFGTPTSGLLSESYGTGAAAAYSVRQLANTASKCMRIVVDSAATVGTLDSSDPEYDIGFDTNGDLDTAAIVSYCNNPSGTNYNAYVTKWYDQSGNGNDASQTSYTAMPQIYNGSAVITENGKPALDFNGTSDYLKTTTYAVELSQNNASVFTVHNSAVAASNTQYLLAEADSASPYSSNFIYGNFDPPGGGTTNIILWMNGTHFGTSVSGQCLSGFDYNGTNFQAHLNGSSSGSSATATVNTEANTSTYIASQAQDSSSVYFDGKVQEIITYKTNKSSNRSAIEGNINGYFSIYT